MMTHSQNGASTASGDRADLSVGLPPRLFPVFVIYIFSRLLTQAQSC